MEYIAGLLAKIRTQDGRNLKQEVDHLAATWSMVVAVVVLLLLLLLLVVVVVAVVVVVVVVVLVVVLGRGVA